MPGPLLHTQAQVLLNNTSREDSGGYGATASLVVLGSSARAVQGAATFDSLQVYGVPGNYTLQVQPSDRPVQAATLSLLLRPCIAGEAVKVQARPVDGYDGCRCVWRLTCTWATRETPPPRARIVAYGHGSLHSSQGRPPHSSFCIQRMVINHLRPQGFQILSEIRPERLIKWGRAATMACDVCGRGYVSFDPLASSECYPCTRDMHANCTGAAMVPEPGFWHSHPRNPTMHLCLNPDACQQPSPSQMHEWAVAHAGKSIDLLAYHTTVTGVPIYQEYVDMQCATGYQVRGS